MEKYSRNQQIIDSELDDNQVMMHLEKGKYFGLNPVGKRIWEMVETPRTFDEIAEALMEEFNVEEEVCVREVKAFLEEAVSFDIIVKM